MRYQWFSLYNELTTDTCNIRLVMPVILRDINARIESAMAEQGFIYSDDWIIKKAWEVID